MTSINFIQIQANFVALFSLYLESSNQFFMKLLLLATLIMALSCSKSDVISEAQTNTLSCSNSIKAVVKKQNTNESGTEFFYYFSINGNIAGSTDVYPSALTPSLQVEGQRVEVKYNLTDKMHKYVKCEAGHVMDPANPDERTMPFRCV